LIYTWDAPLNNGGSKLQQYHLQIKEADDDTTLSEISITVQALQFKFNNLQPATDYLSRVKVNNLVGESFWTEWAPATSGI
jgi:hypothetical protein